MKVNPQKQAMSFQQKYIIYHTNIFIHFQPGECIECLFRHHIVSSEETDANVEKTTKEKSLWYILPDDVIKLITSFFDIAEICQFLHTSFILRMFVMNKFELKNECDRTSSCHIHSCRYGYDIETSEYVICENECVGITKRSKEGICKEHRCRVRDCYEPKIDCDGQRHLSPWCRLHTCRACITRRFPPSPVASGHKYCDIHERYPKSRPFWCE